MDSTLLSGAHHNFTWYISYFGKPLAYHVFEVSFPRPVSAIISSANNSVNWSYLVNDKVKFSIMRTAKLSALTQRAHYSIQ